MSNKLIYDKWKNFINDKKYNKYFQSQYEDFIINLRKVKIYIDENNKRPSEINKEKDIALLGRWITKQLKYCKSRQYNMKYNNIYNKWIQFINNEKYKIYFANQEQKFIINLNKVKIYIDNNNKRPSINNKDNNISYLGGWITTQQTNYKNKIKNIEDIYIYNKWTEFINDNKYKIYFQTNEENFIMNLNNLKKYINENKKRPSQHSKEKNIRMLGQWISHNTTNYKNKQNNMKDEKIYKKWTEFINNDKYKQYFECI
jgi:hypothetical protein